MKNSIKNKILYDFMCQICTYCNDDLRDIRELLKYRYKIRTGTDMSRIMKDFEQIIFDKTQYIIRDNRFQEFFKKIKGESYGK